MQNHHARSGAGLQARTGPDARSIVLSRGGDWHGQYGLAPCPVCQPERRRDQRALSVTDRPGGGLLASCHKSGCSFPDILAGLGLAAGRPAPMPAPSRPAPDDAERTRRALAIWNAGEPVVGSPGERYLARRGIRLDLAALDHVIRFHGACPWGRERVPALVVRMQTLPAMQTCGVQRIALADDGSKLGKKMLGKAGFAFVTDDAVTGPAFLVEGIEDALALHSIGAESVWAGMSALGMSRFPLMRHFPELTIIADGDAAGIEAAQTCAARWREAGRVVRLMRAPDQSDPAAVLARGGA